MHEAHGAARLTVAHSSARPSGTKSIARACRPGSALTLLNVVVRQGAAVLQLLSGENETLLVRGDACDGKGAGGQVKDLEPRAPLSGCSRMHWCVHSPSLAFHTAGCPYPPRGRPQPQLTLLVLNLALHIVDSVRGLHLQGDSLAREGLRRKLSVT